MAEQIILASSSPRRKELLILAGLSFEVRVSDIDETPRRGESPKLMVKRLALEKGREVSKSATTGSRYIISADTTVVSPRERNLGKPRDEAEAIRMVRSLQGRTHRVYTGYAILKIESGRIVREISRVVTTRVTMKKMSTAEIRAYVARGECLDKAGAYAAQGFGMVLIERISGSYTNVVGIPVTQVLGDLGRLGWKR